MNIDPFEENPEKAEKYVTQSLENIALVSKHDDILSTTCKKIGVLWAETPMPIIQSCIQIDRGERIKAASLIGQYLGTINSHSAHQESVRNWASLIGLKGFE